MSDQKDNWDKAKSGATTLSLPIVPILIAWLSYRTDLLVDQSETRRITLEIAIGILSDEPPNADEVNAKALRAWAIDAIGELSTFEFSPEATQQLATEKIYVTAPCPKSRVSAEAIARAHEIERKIDQMTDEDFLKSIRNSPHSRD